VEGAYAEFGRRPRSPIILIASGGALLLRVLVFALSAVPCIASATFLDPLDQPAEVVSQPAAEPLSAIANTGERLVAVGQHGVIIYADAAGEHWRQSKVPVSADLTALSFANRLEGWAVGHGGVVLHTADGGVTWVKQLDGRTAGDIAQQYYETRATSIPEGQRDALLVQARELGEEKAEQPFLDVWFKDQHEGFVVGTFNRVFRTADGGKSWVPLIDKTTNPDALHFYAVRGMGDQLYIVGERGGVWRWDHAQARFVSANVPYDGSLFGLVVTPDAVLAFGMRGAVFRTVDQGVHWTRIPTPLDVGIVAGDVCSNAHIVLASQAGDVMVSSDHGASFKLIKTSRRTAVSNIVSSSQDRLVEIGQSGVHVLPPVCSAAPSK
jgi:photosystem II stability/assembly factor-like uncharacterized protein